MDRALNHTNFSESYPMKYVTTRKSNSKGKLMSALVSVVSNDVIRLREIDRKIRSLFISVDTSLVSKAGLERSQIMELNRLKWTLWESKDTRIDPTPGCVYARFRFFSSPSPRYKNALFRRDPILSKISKIYQTFFYIHTRLHALFISCSTIVNFSLALIQPNNIPIS